MFFAQKNVKNQDDLISLAIIMYYCLNVSLSFKMLSSLIQFFLQIIPDSLTTLLQYLSHLRQEFPAYGQIPFSLTRYFPFYCSLLTFKLFLDCQSQAKVQMFKMGVVGKI